MIIDFRCKFMPDNASNGGVWTNNQRCHIALHPHFPPQAKCQEHIHSKGQLARGNWQPATGNQQPAPATDIYWQQQLTTHWVRRAHCATYLALGGMARARTQAVLQWMEEQNSAKSLPIRMAVILYGYEIEAAHEVSRLAGPEPARNKMEFGFLLNTFTWSKLSSNWCHTKQSSFPQTVHNFQKIFLQGLIIWDGSMICREPAYPTLKYHLCSHRCIDYN